MRQETLSLRIESDVNFLLDKASKDVGIPKSHLVRLSILEFLSKCENEDILRYAQMLKKRAYADMVREETKLIMRCATHSKNTKKLIERLKSQNVDEVNINAVIQALENEAEILGSIHEVRAEMRKQQRGLYVNTGEITKL